MFLLTNTQACHWWRVTLDYRLLSPRHNSSQTPRWTKKTSPSSPVVTGLCSETPGSFSHSSWLKWTRQTRTGWWWSSPRNETRPLGASPAGPSWRKTPAPRRRRRSGPQVPWLVDGAGSVHRAMGEVCSVWLHLIPGPNLSSSCVNGIKNSPLRRKEEGGDLFQPHAVCSSLSHNTVRTAF